MSSLLINCGGGGSSGGFTTPGDTLSIEITANDTVLPANETLEGPDPSLPFTNTFTVVVRDEEGKIFPADSITVALNAPDGVGALYYLDGDPEHEEEVTDANGNTITVPLAFRNQTFEDTSGIITSHFHAFSQSGTASIVASVIDPASGSSASASLQITVIAEDNPISSLTFTGPFVEAVRAGAASFLGAGTFTRQINVIATNANGQPVSPNTQIDFFLVDSPIENFPGGGPGSFLVAGSDGNPVESGVFFSAASGNFINEGVIPFDRLVLDGTRTNQPNNLDITGIRTVGTVLNATQLNVTEPFNANSAGDQGPTVPYVIGRARFGTILSRAFTDVGGVATTFLTYPAQRLGQTAILVACSTDKTVCTVLNTCDVNGANCSSVYLPVGGALTLTTSASEIAANTTVNVELCLRDGSGAGVQGAAIDFTILGTLGNATVTVDGLSFSGTIPSPTGANGCVTVPISSSGVLPDSDPRVEFTADGIDEPVIVTIIPPGAVELTGLANCEVDGLSTTPCPATVACTANLLVTDDLGTPIPGVTITLDDATNIDSVTFDPALSAVSGQSGTDGTNNVTFAIAGFGDNTARTYDGSITFNVGGSTFDFAVNLVCPTTTTP